MLWGRSKGGSQAEPTNIGSSWTWADEIDPDTLGRIAEVTYRLFQTPERWIHRRVERIYFKDNEVAHHQVSVDFTLQSDVRPVGTFEGKDVYVAPLFLLVKNLTKPPREGKRPRRRFLLVGKRRPPDLTKRVIPMAPYSNLDVKSECGHRLPLLTRRQSSLIAVTMLLEAAERALKKPVPQKLKEEILKIPYRNRLDLAEVLSYLFEDHICCCDPRNKLRKDKTFSELAYTLASHSIIVCAFIGPPGRCVYKLSYDEPLNEGFSTKKGRIRRSLGLKSEQYSVALNEIGASASYHVEIEIPDGLLINAVNLIGKRYRWYTDLETRRRQSYSIRQVGKATEGKIYIPEPLPGRRVGLAWVKLRVQRSGFLVGGFVASILVTLMLVVGAFAVPVVIHEHQSEAAATTLLLLPALLAAYIARPGEHAITARMLRWARYALVVDGMLPAVAVFLLITMQHHEEQRKKVEFPVLGVLKLGKPSAVWVGLAAFSVIFILLFAWTNYFPRPRGRTVYLPRPKN